MTNVLISNSSMLSAKYVVSTGIFEPSHVSFRLGLEMLEKCFLLD